MALRLMVADDHLAIRQGVIGLVQGTEIEVVCQAETSEQTVKCAITCEPDVLLLDMRLPDADGLEVMEALRAKGCHVPVLIFSASEDVKELARARRLGAAGFVAKGASREELLDAIRRVAAEKSAWTTRQIRQAVSRAASDAIAANDRNPLSPREMEVLRLITDGFSNDGIAEELKINIETVKQHVKHILRKLCVEDRTQAALTAIWLKLFENAASNEAATQR
jgi:DNA-binding NarL/FixJ family response regulator